MEIIATINNEVEHDYLDEWRRELGRCESVKDMYELFFEHESIIKADPAILELFRTREGELETPWAMIRQGRTMSKKQINQAVKQACRNDDK